MRTLDPEALGAVWAAVEALVPAREDNHPLGCHNPRISDRICFRGILIRLVTGCSWETAEWLLDGAVSDTTLRARRDEWVEAGVFDALATEALAGYDRIVGLDLAEVSVDGSQHKAPCGGEGTGKNPCDRAKSGWKWSLATDADGIPVGWATDGANRHDSILFEPTLDSVADRGLVFDVETLHLDRAYDSKAVRGSVRSGRHHRRGLRPEATARPSQPHQTTNTARYALDRREDQLLAIELRAATPQHRPTHPTPAGTTLPRDNLHHHHQTHRLAKPLEPHQLTPTRGPS